MADTKPDTPPKGPETMSESIHVKTKASFKRDWVSSAQREGLTLARWASKTLAAAARKIPWTKP